MFAKKLLAASLAASALLMAPVPQAMALVADGAIYTLEVSPISGGFDYLLHIDLTNYTGGGSYLDSVAFKAGSSFDTFSVIAAPEGVAAWTVHENEILSAGGCGGGGAGWACLEGTSNGGLGYNILPLASNSDVQFEVQFTGTGLTSNSVLLKARYVDEFGNKVGTLVSAPVPEPESYALMLAGLGLVGVIARRRLRIA